MRNFLFQNNDSLDELLKSFLMDELEPGTGDQSSEGERRAWEGGILDQCQGGIGFNPTRDVSVQDTSINQPSGLEWGAWADGILDQCQGDIGFNPMEDVSAQDLDPSKSILDQICGEFFIREAGRCNFLI